VLDTGGKPIYDNEGNIKGKTLPLMELSHNGKIKQLVSVAIKNVMNEHFLELDDLKSIWMSFLCMDKKNRGFITLQHLADYLEETNYSVVAPYMERYFELIDKSMGTDRCNFEEFFASLCAFNMFTRTEMIAFVFSMLDKDNDQIISQVDMLKFSS